MIDANPNLVGNNNFSNVLQTQILATIDQLAADFGCLDNIGNTFQPRYTPDTQTGLMTNIFGIQYVDWAVEGQNCP